MTFPFRRTLISALALALALVTVNLAATDAPSAYQVQPRDFLEITVYGEADLAARQRVDSEGRIRVPLLGNVKVVGLTVREIEELLQKEFRDQRYLRSPQVTAAVAEYGPREIIMLGEVGRPGPLNLPAGETTIDIVDLIARAGDFSGIANSTKVMVKRTMDDGSVKEFIIDVDDIITDRERGKRVNSFEVHAGDIVYVPERLF